MKIDPFQALMKQKKKAEGHAYSAERETASGSLKKTATAEHRHEPLHTAPLRP